MCPLDIIQIELSLDGKYLAVACGSPTFKVIIVSVEEKKILGGTQGFISLKGRDTELVQISFNPTNRKTMALAFKNKLEIYEIKDCLEMH